mgnify:CR=1 FL=1
MHTNITRLHRVMLSHLMLLGLINFQQEGGLVLDQANKHLAIATNSLIGVGNLLPATALQPPKPGVVLAYPGVQQADIVSLMKGA